MERVRTQSTGRAGRAIVNPDYFGERGKRGGDGGPRVIAAACFQRRASLLIILPPLVVILRRSGAETVTDHAEKC
jgi:hypothetical protein